jgi:hypothetical protein
LQGLWEKACADAVDIEDEVERSVSKMGFVKRGEFEALKQEVASLKQRSTQKKVKKSTEKKKPVKKAKKLATKKVVK